MVYQASAYLRFLWHEATTSISTPPWMGRQSIAGIPPALNSPVPIYTQYRRHTDPNGRNDKNIYLSRFSFHIVFSNQPLRKNCIANRKIGQFCLNNLVLLPFHFILVIFAVGISVPSIFCILKFLLILVYLRSGTLIGLLPWLYCFSIPFIHPGGESTVRVQCLAQEHNTMSPSQDSSPERSIRRRAQ